MHHQSCDAFSLHPPTTLLLQQYACFLSLPTCKRKQPFKFDSQNLGSEQSIAPYSPLLSRTQGWEVKFVTHVQHGANASTILPGTVITVSCPLSSYFEQTITNKDPNTQNFTATCTDERSVSRGTRLLGHLKLHKVVHM